MKTVALLGGMTYNATSIYYNLINRHIQRTLGGTNSATLLLHSFNHAEMGRLFTSENWDEVTARFATAARNLKAAGADGVMICCNIGHRVADAVEKQSGLPLLHIADDTGVKLQRRGITKVALIGTKPVMEQAFFAGRLKRKFDVEVVVPSKPRRDAIHEMIFEELGANIFTSTQKELLVDVIRDAKAEGAQGVVLACTELQFVVKAEDVDVPLFDTMEAHALGAAEWMLADEKAVSLRDAGFGRAVNTPDS